MKIIRFFLSNLILITFFCAIIYAYYYWDNLTGEDTPAGQAIAYLSKEYKGFESFVDGIKIKQGDEKVAESTGSDEPVVEPASEIEALSSVKEDVFVTPEIEEALNHPVDYEIKQPAETSTSADTAGTKEDPVRALWIDARKAFYKRDYEGSITSYKQLIADTTDNYDAYGELGNVYFNHGKKVEAADAYFQAASLLVKLGHDVRANSLLPVLSYLDAEKAEQLRTLMREKRS